MIPNQWYAILPSKMLRKGRLLAVRRLGLDLVMFRDGQGRAGCVVDQCPHRGVALSHGVLKGDCVQCPFHGLEFDVAGKCRRVPSIGKATSADSLKRYNVKSYAVREAYGIVYLWYGDAERATDGALPFFPEHVDGPFAWSEIADLWNTHYSRAIENQLDVVHLPFVHHNTIGRGNQTLVHGPKVVFEDGQIVTSANNEVDAGQRPKPESECEIRSTYLMFRFPNVWMNHISDRILVIVYFAPVDDENTILYLRFYGKPTPFRWLNRFVAWTGKYANRVIERQDKRVVVTQKPKASSYRSDEKLVPGDRPIVVYRNMREEKKGTL
jgi:phenylpropionate dioxygenase-like ring-hydroxylating dioxygenase large terminal subunit